MQVVVGDGAVGLSAVLAAKQLGQSVAFGAFWVRAFFRSVPRSLTEAARIDGANVHVVHSLTSMGCPVGPMIQEEIERVVREIPGVGEVESELTFDPPWTPERMSDDAKFILGFG